MKNNINKMPKIKKDQNKYLWFFFIVFTALLVGVIIYSRQNDQKKENINLTEEKEINNSINEEEIAYVDGDKEKEVKEEGPKDNSNEAKEESEVNNENNEKNKEADKNIYKASFAGQSLSFEYPDNWQANQLEEKNKFSFGPEGKAIAEEYQGDIIIAYKENKQKLPIERYYDGLNDINLFEDATGGFNKEEGNKYNLYRFKNVIGYTSSTIGVFVLSDSFVEMTDVYNTHQGDGVFDQLVKSFKAE